MTNNYDVIIMGGGIAGLYAALNLDKNLHVLLLSKRELSLSNSNLAQGGIARRVRHRTRRVQKHINDTLVARRFPQQPQGGRNAIATEGPRDVRRLIELGVDFDRTETRRAAFDPGGRAHPRTDSAS